MYIRTTLSVLVLTILVPYTALADPYSIPAHQHEVKPEEVRISPDSSVSASYQIPLVSPPGRKGIEPSLSLTYNSNNTDQTSPTYESRASALSELLTPPQSSGARGTPPASTSPTIRNEPEPSSP